MKFINRMFCLAMMLAMLCVWTPGAQAAQENQVVYAGGVMANTQLREHLSTRFGGRFAPPMYSADNAAGIACLCRIAYEECIR